MSSEEEKGSSEEEKGSSEKGSSEEEKGSSEGEIMDKIDYAVKAADGIRRGCGKFKIVVPDGGGVNVIFKEAGRIGPNGLPRGRPIVRVNPPPAHAGHVHNLHVNLQPHAPAIHGAEAHIRVPAQAVGAAGKVARVVKGANKVLVPVAIAMDAYHVGTNIKNDYDNKTSRNTVEAVAGVAGGWGGGIGGAAAGAAIGTAIFPGLGTLIGGIVGGVAGGIGVSIGAEKAAEAIGDACDYNIEERVCKSCKKKFKIRKYRGEDDELCVECRKR